MMFVSNYYPDKLDQSSKVMIDYIEDMQKKKNQPPIGINKEPIQLHHLKQDNRGTLIEVLAKDEHKKEYKIWHRYKTESEIDRSKFNAFRSSYWKERGKRLEK